MPITNARPAHDSARTPALEALARAIDDLARKLMPRRAMGTQPLADDMNAFGVSMVIRQELGGHVDSAVAAILHAIESDPRESIDGVVAELRRAHRDAQLRVAVAEALYQEIVDEDEDEDEEDELDDDELDDEYDPENPDDPSLAEGAGS